MAGNPFDDLIPRPGAAQNAPDDVGADATVPIPGTVVHGQLYPPKPPATTVSASAQPQTPGGWTDPQQYAEIAKGVIPGMVQSAGTVLQSPDVFAARAQQGSAKWGSGQLSVMDRIDRGEAVPDMDDALGYQHMSPDQKAAARDGLARAQEAFAPTPVQDRSLFKAGEGVQQFGRGLIPAAPGYEEAFGRQVGEGLGSVAVGLPVAYFGGTAAGAAIFGSMGVGEATQRAVEFDRKERAAGRPGLTQDQITSAGILGVGPGTTDILPVEVLLGRLPVKLPPVLMRPVAQAIARIGSQALVEGVQEGGQGFLQDLIAREVYNSGQVLGENFWNEASVGAGVGGLAEIIRQMGAGMVRSAAGRRGVSPPQPQPQATQATPEPAQRQEPVLPWPDAKDAVSPSTATPEASTPQAAQPPAAARGASAPEAPVPRGGNPFADLVPANTNKPIDQQWLSQLADTLAASRQADREPDIAARRHEPEPQQKPALEPLAQPDMKPVTQVGPQRIVTPDGSMEIEAVPVVVELDDLRLAEGSLQPRDRSRAEYTQGARERASQLDPSRLQPDRTSDRGAPIILIDGTVISGNGRTMSIAEVYRNPDLADRAEAYKASLGPSAQGMRQPVLVMQAQSLAPQDAQRFADLSNRSAIAQMSATERAMRDAQAIGPEGIQLYQGGDFTSPQNRRFLQDFMTRAVTAAEMPSVSRNGELTQEGAQRLRSAVLASAYGDAGVLSRMLESTDDNVRSITAGLLDAAPKMAQLRAAIASGEVAADMDAVPALMAAINTISDLRSRRVSVQTWLAQTDAFGRDPVIEAWVKSFYYDDSNRAKRQEKIAQLLNDYASEAILHRPEGLFADETTPTDVLGVARRKNDDGQADDLFASASGVGQGVPESRKRAEGRPDETGRQGTGQGQQADEILAALQYAPPSIDRDARELIRDAQRYERELRASGATADQIASEFTRYYGSPVSAADVEAGNVWWARLAGERFDDGGTDKSNISADWSPDLADIIVSSNPLSEGEAASMNVDAKPSQPQRLRGVEGGSSVGPRLTPAMRNAAIALGQQGLNAKQIASELRQQFGQYVRDGEVQAYVDAHRRDTLSAASAAKTRQAASERMAALNARPGFREANAERIRALMATPEMQEILRERGRALAEQKGDTVWTPQMVERLGSPEVRAMTASNAATALGHEFPSARFSANSVNRKRHTLGYNSESGSGKSPFTPDMERRLSDRDMRLLRADEVVARLRAEFGEDATSRITPTTITNKRSGNPSISYIGKTTNPAGFQWSMRGDGRSPDNRLAELMRDKISPAQRADILNKEFGQPGMPSVTPKAVQKRWEKIKTSVLKAQGDEPMFAAGGWDPRSWFDWIRDTPNAGREDATSVSRTGDQGGGAPPGQQPGTASVSSGSATEPESGRADGVRQSFRVRDFLGRVVEAPPNSLGLRQSYLFLHPPKVTWPFVKSATTTLKNLDSGVPNWMAKAHVSEIEPGVWQVMNFSVRKKQAADGLTPDFLDAIQSELGDIRPPDQMRPETYQAWRAWEMQGSRWATTSIDDYVEHRGQFYSPEMIRTLHAAARRLATSGGSAEDRNRARREFNELSDLIDLLPPEDDILAAIQAYHGSPHDFDRFDMSRIGTGEGAQAYGHGLYFAENEGVAKSYRDALAVPTFEVPRGLSNDATRNLTDIASAYDGKLSKSEFDAVLRDKRSPWDNPSWIDELQAAADTGRISFNDNPGRMYEVRINADPSDFLDWDKPLSQQSEKVRAVLSDIIRKSAASDAASNARSYTSMAAKARGDAKLDRAAKYDDLSRMTPDDYFNDIMRKDPRVSEMVSSDKRFEASLREAGIPGIRYLDQGSRSTGEGSRNYVVFDDSIIEIVAKDGKPVSKSERDDILAAHQGPPSAQGAASSLDMSPEARKARAEAMGFDTSRVWYHGTRSGDQFDAFKIGLPTQNSMGLLGNVDTKRSAVFFSNSDDFASEYGSRVAPYYVRGNVVPLTREVRLDFAESVDAFGPDRDLWSSIKYGRNAWELFDGQAGDRFKAWSQDNGIDGYTFDEWIDRAHGSGDVGGETLAVFDPSNIRSINAAFDPAQETSANLMAAVNGEVPKRDPRRVALDAVVRMGRPYVISDRVFDGIHRAIEPSMSMVPPDVMVGVMSRIEPVKDDKRLARAIFVTRDLDEFAVVGEALDLVGFRALAFPKLNAIGLIRYDLASDVGNPVSGVDRSKVGNVVSGDGVLANEPPSPGLVASLRGDIAHEVTHILRRSDRIPRDVWSRLLSQANALRLLDSDYRTYLQSVNNPNYTTIQPGITGREIYTRLYGNKPLFDERMDQEAVTHMVDLYSHGGLLPVELGDVGPILDSILDGSIWRVRQEDAGSALEVRPMDTSDLHQIAQANFDTPYAIDPVQSVPIDSLKGGAYSEKKVGPLAKQISANGWIEPLVVDGDGNVIEGQHRLRAMAKIGAQAVPVHRIRERVPAKLAAAMVKAARDTGIHHDQAQTIAGQIATIIDKEGVAALDEYEPPRGFEKAWDAAVSAAKQGEMELMGADRDDALASAQKGQTRLAALHNLSAENLAFADKMGGIAAPSVAVVKEGMGIEDGAFGDITLIGRRDLADPKSNPVFDSDAWTARFPRAEYRPVPSAKAQKFVDALRPYAAKYENTSPMHAVWDEMVNKPDPERAVQTLLRSEGAQAMFLDQVKGKAIEPVMRPATDSMRNPWAAMPSFQAFIKRVGGYNQEWRPDTPEWQALSDAARIAHDEWVDREAKGDPELKEIIGAGGVVSEDGQLPFGGPMTFISNDLDKVGKKEVNKSKTRERIERAMKPFEIEFKSWVEKQIVPMYGDPRIKVDGRFEPYTLENILRVMTGPRIKAQEKHITFGPGKARADAAHRIGDLNEARNRAEWQMGPSADVKEARERADKLMEQFRNEVVPHNKYVRANAGSSFGSTWEALDGQMRALARWAKGRQDVANLRSALAREDFTNVPQDVLELGVQAGKAFLEAPVPYFESKPQRAVSLNEFAGAVVPRGTSPETLAILDKHGIPYRFYSKKSETSQAEAAAKFTRDLAKQGEDTLFAVQRGRYRNLDPLGYYSRLDEVLSSLNPKDKVTLQTLTSKGVKASEIEARGLMELFTPRQGDRTDSATARDGSMNQSTIADLDRYADIVIGNDIKSVTLVGSTASGAAGRDIDLVYDLGARKLPTDPIEAADHVTQIIESSTSPIDLDRYDSFFKVGNRYFHASSGAGREIVENTTYGKDQSSKPRIPLGINTISIPVSSLIETAGRNRVDVKR